MLGERECRWLESVHGMTRVALVRISRVLKLPSVRILMTIGASSECDLVSGVLSGRNMAFGALDRRVFSHQRVSALLVHGNVVQRRLERIVSVAHAAIFACKLAFMGVRRVAIGASIVCDGLGEVARFMAAVTRDFGMRALQCELRFIVIESRRRGPHQLPSLRHMAALARGGKRATMRIGVTVAASSKRNTCVGYKQLGVFGARLMASGAGHALMLASQRIFACTVLKAVRGFPAFQRVAALAIGAELAAMLIRVARRARGR